MRALHVAVGASRIASRIAWHALDLTRSALLDLEALLDHRRARRERSRWYGIGGAA